MPKSWRRENRCGQRSLKLLSKAPLLCSIECCLLLPHALQLCFKALAHHSQLCSGLPGRLELRSLNSSLHSDVTHRLWLRLLLLK